MISFLFLDSMENISASEKYLRGLRFRFPHILDMIVEMLTDISFVKFSEASSAIIEERNVVKKALKRQIMLQNTPNQDGISPLHIAARNGQKKICEYMMRNENIIPNPIDHLGDTPMHYAAQKGHLEIIKILVERIENMKEPMKKQTLNHFELEVAMSLIEDYKSNEKLNPKNIYGRTPLHIAVQFSHLSVAKLIIQKVKDKNPRTDYGRTLLETALRNKSTRIREFVKNYLDSFSVKI